MERMLRGGLNIFSCAGDRILQCKVELHRVLMAEYLGNRIESVRTSHFISGEDPITNLQLANRLRPFACCDRGSRSKAIDAAAAQSLPSVRHTRPSVFRNLP